VVNSSGCTSENLVCSAITKNEVLMNVISEAEVQSNIFIERGKNSALEMIERLGEISSVGDLEEYGYKFYNIIKI
jgi:arabinogalactan endo-1,4-beta-galactosidase